MRAGTAHQEAEVEREDREEKVPARGTLDEDRGLLKVWGSLGVAAVYAIFLMLGIALAPGESRALIAGIGSLVFLLGAAVFIYRQSQQRRHRGH